MRQGGLSQNRPSEQDNAEFRARLDRARARAGLGPRKELADDQRAQLEGKSIGQKLLLFRKWHQEREDSE